jgi:methyl-accepting chemotaxis protein
MISEIVRQTNLLTQNTAVKDAMVMEHGKGFAAVAAEILRLAERSEKTVVEIDNVPPEDVITEEIDKMLQEIVTEMEKTSKLTGEITASGIEQSSDFEKVNRDLQKLNLVANQNAHVTERIIIKSKELNSKNDLLKDTISFFKIHEASNEKSTGRPVNPLNTIGNKGGTTSNSKGNLPYGFELDLREAIKSLDSNFQKF